MRGYNFQKHFYVEFTVGWYFSYDSKDFEFFGKVKPMSLDRGVRFISDSAKSRALLKSASQIQSEGVGGGGVCGG